MEQEKFTFFYQGVFSQWYPCTFKIEGVGYNCAEQFMMATKARLMYDDISLAKIMATTSPKEQKKLGREILNFDVEGWNKCAKDFVFVGNYAKFNQNPDLKKILMETVGTTLVEASPYDKIWGIGLSSSDPRAQYRNTWEGTNWLGEVLTTLREFFWHRNLVRNI